MSRFNPFAALDVEDDSTEELEDAQDNAIAEFLQGSEEEEEDDEEENKNILEGKGAKDLEDAEVEAIAQFEDDLEGPTSFSFRSFPFLFP